MKRNYETPFAEKIEFNYADTVVASTTGGHQPDAGGGNGQGGGCDHNPYHWNENMKNGTCKADP